ncbi:alpha/beta hydrolase family protein [Streptomyces sp. NPDC049040]|uniref:alpha/beta hydrolase family protein n=1 Tax=Streptomyces sp. NPDC049040 TaxID=3365593 RepID=UPI003712E54A
MLTADRSPGRGPAPLRMSAASALAVSFALLTGCLLTGCGGGGDTADGSTGGAPAPTAEVNDFGCLSPEQASAGYLTFTSSENQDVEAYATGKGTTVLVLAHQADGDVCQWVPDADELAKEGYRVIAVDSAGSEVAEITAAVTHARAEGARKVLLVGASKGGTAVLTSAGSITPPVDAVVSLSAPASYSGMDAAGTVPGLTMPVFYMAAEGDTEFAASTRDLSKATGKAGENDLTIVDGPNHGVSMLDNPDNFAKVKAFLRKYGG